MVYKSKRRAPKEQTSGAFTPNYKYPTFHTGGSKNNHFVQIGEALKDIDHRLGATGDAKVKVDNIVDATDLGKDILLSADTKDVRDILEVQTVAETKTAIDAAVTAEANTRIAEDARLQTAINTETAARTAADAALQTKIEEETAARTEADATLQTNIDNEAKAREAAVTAEADARTKADDKLTADLAAEVANRTKAVADEQKAREIADQTEAATREKQDAAITATINTEILDRKNAGAALQTAIDNEAKTRKTADDKLTADLAKEVSDRTDAVRTEEAARTAADAKLTSDLAAEVTARTEADAAETAARTAADKTLTDNLAKEVSDREAAVSQEATARTEADANLQAAIDTEKADRTAAVKTVSDAVAKEVSDRKAAVTAENTARVEADRTLQNNIDAEKAARTEADTTLQNNIDLKADKTALPTKVSELQNDSDFQSGAQVDAKIAEATTTVYNYKGAVNTPDDLPAGSNQNPNKVGDTYNDKSTGMNYVWDGKAWDALGAVTTLATLGVTATAEELNYTKGVTSAIQTQIDSKLAADANAVSAAKLETARNIALNGDVTGTVAFDGSADVTVNAVIASESVEPAMLLTTTEEEKTAFRTAIAAASAADLATETTARKATDAAVAKETQDRTAAVKTVSDAITKETRDRENSVTALNASIDTKLAIADKPTADTLSGATDTGKAVLKAANAEAARTAIGAGTSSFSGSWNDLTDKPALLKGDKGEQGNPGVAGPTGPAAGFGVPTVTVDNTVGTPSATVTAEGEDTAKIFNFAFTGIKGEKGDRGEVGPAGPKGEGIGAASTLFITVDEDGGQPSGKIINNGDSNHDGQWDFTFAFKNLKGPKGEPGERGPKGEPGADGKNAPEYVLPAATKNALGGVKLIEFDNAIGKQAAHATIAEDATVDAAAFNSLVTDYNKLLAEFNNVISNMVAAGICTRP